MTYFSHFLSRYVLPVEPHVQKLVHVFYTQPGLVAPYAKARSLVSIVMYIFYCLQLILWAEAILLERDIRVWNSKR